MLRIVEIYAVNQVNKAVQYYEKIEDNKLLSQKYGDLNNYFEIIKVCPTY